MRFGNGYVGDLVIAESVGNDLLGPLDLVLLCNLT